MSFPNNPPVLVFLCLLEIKDSQQRTTTKLKRSAGQTLRTTVRTERAQTRGALEALMREAWFKRDSRKVWKIARRLAGKTKALNAVFANSTPYHPNQNF